MEYLSYSLLPQARAPPPFFEPFYFSIFDEFPLLEYRSFREPLPPLSGRHMKRQPLVNTS